MGYFWESKLQETSYRWTGLMSKIAYRPRWTNPASDIPQRTNLRKGVIVSSEPIDWPKEYHGGKINTATAQKVWMGSVGGGIPAQRVDASKSRLFRITNKYGGELYKDGVKLGYRKAGKAWDVLVPEPVRLKEDGWAVEGYPNAANNGDRHWYGVEDNGITHEMIWTVAEEHYKVSGLTAFKPNPPNTASNYCRYSPTGELLDGVKHKNSGAYGVVKGNISWLSVAWNAHDEPHTLGIVWNELANVGLNGESSDGLRSDWTHPAYGGHYRLSQEGYSRLIETATPEQKNFLDAARFYGFITYDRGGTFDYSAPLGAGIAKVAGAQHVDLGLDVLDLLVTDLELVTEV